MSGPLHAPKANDRDQLTSPDKSPTENAEANEKRAEALEAAIDGAQNSEGDDQEGTQDR